MDHLVELVRSEHVDAVLVSGDVYDRAVPPTDSVRLLDETLRRLSERTRVVLTPGNYDSARCLGFASGLLCEGLVIQARTDSAVKANPFSTTYLPIFPFLYAIVRQPNRSIEYGQQRGRLLISPIYDSFLGSHHTRGRKSYSFPIWILPSNNCLTNPFVNQLKFSL